MTTEFLATTPLERVKARASAERPGLSYYLGWFFAFLLLAWAWQGAEIRLSI